MTSSHVRQVTGPGQGHSKRVVGVRLSTPFVVGIFEFSSQQLCSANFHPTYKRKLLETFLFNCMPSVCQTQS